MTAIAAAPSASLHPVRFGRDQWAAEIDAFTRRNAGHIVVLEESDVHTGAFTQERGYVLFGVTFDATHNEIEVILGEADGRRRHQTTVLRSPASVALVRDETGADHALRIEYGSRTALLSVQHAHSQE